MDMFAGAKPFDPLPLAKALIQRPSVTPEDAGALGVLEAALEPLGFQCRRLPFGDVDNLFARWGEGDPHIAFAGHTDVVPPGEDAAWTHPPFEAACVDGRLWGRGASDMKGAIAAFVAAVGRFVTGPERPRGAITLIITGDEEGPAVHGTRPMMAALEAAGERFDQVIVGEPSNPQRLGEMMKIGRRGSLNGVITATGRQGHVAYPHRAANPVPALLDGLAALRAWRLDEGYARFQPSNLEITSVDVGNPAHNVIPARAQAKFNIRFNPNHRGEDLKAEIVARLAAASTRDDVELSTDLRVTGEAFLADETPFVARLAEIIAEETGLDAELSTSGGTSDARFIKDYAPVVEFGLVGATIHQVNEYAEIADIERLSHIYHRALVAFFDR
ncbi:MAG: succinyl-diaminopimelate desuccinylase [Maricaulaceae bacterium]